MATALSTQPTTLARCDRNGAEDYHGDGDDNGHVDDDDYVVWQNGFGTLLDDSENAPGGQGQIGAGGACLSQQQVLYA